MLSNASKTLLNRDRFRQGFGDNVSPTSTGDILEVNAGNIPSVFPDALGRVFAVRRCMADIQIDAKGVTTDVVDEF